MSRPLTIRKPNADELHQLHQWLEQPWQSWQRRRAEVLLLYAADGSVSSIAQLLQVHRNTVLDSGEKFTSDLPTNSLKARRVAGRGSFRHRHVKTCCGHVPRYQTIPAQGKSFPRLRSVGSSLRRKAPRLEL